MPLITLTDRNFAKALGRSAALILISDGSDKLRSDFKTAFTKAADEEEDLRFAQVDPRANRQLGQLFDYQNKALLIGYYRGEAMLRRSRPWSSDLPDFMQTMRAAQEADAPRVVRSLRKKKRKPAALSKPLDVSDKTFEKEVVQASHKLPVIVDFWAEWCGPCKMVAPILEKLAAEFAGQVRIAKVDTDQNPALSQAFQVRSIPTIAICKQGEVIFMQPGAFPEATFRDLIKQSIALKLPPKQVAPAKA